MTHNRLIKLSDWSITSACKVQTWIINKIDSVWQISGRLYIHTNEIRNKVNAFILLCTHPSTQPL